MNLYNIYRALNTDTATNVICNELAEKVYDQPVSLSGKGASRAYMDAMVTVLFHNRAPETGYTRDEITELVEAALAG